MSVKIEGNLLHDDEESSASESEDGHGYDAPLDITCEHENSDEELEVFNGDSFAVAKDMIKMPPTQAPTVSPSFEISIGDDVDIPETNVADSSYEPANKSLITLIGAIVGSNHTTEADNVATHAPTPLSHSEDSVTTITGTKNLGIAGFGDTATSAPTQLDTVYSNAASNEHDESSARDAFGIAYRPYRKPKPTYNMPSGPAFEDEAEFEKELLESSVLIADAHSSAADDEFDFDGDGPALVRSVLANSAIAITAIEENISKHGTVDATEVEMSSGLDRSGRDDTAESTKGKSVLDAAREALAEITGIYSSGLGDHEITLMTSKTDESASTQSSITGAGTGTGGGGGGGGVVGGTIEEVDEDELERLEEEEDRRQKEAVSSEQRRERELHMQWEAVERAGVSAAAADKVSLEGVGGVSKSPSGRRIVAIKYADAEDILKSQDLSAFRSQIVFNDPDQKWSLLSSNIKLSKASIPMKELELPFLIAQADYDPDTYPRHLELLQSIYKALVVDNGGGSTMCPRQGVHWEAIGFQGSDPRTDLNRSMKMLSVLQILHMIERERGLTQRLYANSLGTGGIMQSPSGASGAVADIDDSWPFMCVGIGMTKHAIDALRSGALTKDVNKAKSCMAVLHEFHHACFYCFSRQLLENPHVHHAVHLADLRREVANDPLGVLRAFRNFKAPKPTDAQGGDKQSSYDDIEEDQRDTSSAGIDNGKTKKGWFGILKDKKASRFVVEEGSHSDK